MNYKEFKQKIKEEIKAYKENIDFKLKKYKENQNKKLEKFKLKFNNKSKIKIKGGHRLYNNQDLLNLYGLYIICLLLNKYYNEYYHYCENYFPDIDNPVYKFAFMYYNTFDETYTHIYNRAPLIHKDVPTTTLISFGSATDNNLYYFERMIYDELQRLLSAKYPMLSKIFTNNCVKRYLSGLYYFHYLYVMPNDEINTLNESLIDFYSNYCIAFFNEELFQYMRILKDLYYPNVVSPDSDKIPDVIDKKFEDFFYSFKIQFETDTNNLQEDLNSYFGDITSYEENIRSILAKIKNISDVVESNNDFSLKLIIACFDDDEIMNIIKDSLLNFIRSIMEKGNPTEKYNALLNFIRITMGKRNPKETYDALLAKIRNKISIQTQVETNPNDTDCITKYNSSFDFYDDTDEAWKKDWDENVKSKNRMIKLSLRPVNGVKYNCYDIYGLFKMLDTIAKQSNPEFVIKETHINENISFDELLNIFKVAKESHYGYLLEKKYLLLLVLLELDEVSLKILYDLLNTYPENVSDFIKYIYALHNFRYDTTQKNWIQIN